MKAKTILVLLVVWTYFTMKNYVASLLINKKEEFAKDFSSSGIN